MSRHIQTIELTSKPIKTWMLRQTRANELTVFATGAHQSTKHPERLPMTTVIPAFVLSEIESAFVIGFTVFIPFMVIDLVVASVLMSMGMFMVPPTLVSLPLKLLLFVLANGWTLVVQSLVLSFHR